MTFSCPHKNPDTGDCDKLDTLCVPGRPGCVQEGEAKFAESVETRIKRAEEIRARRLQKR